MEHSFWHERWTNDEIGFHLPKPHEFLLRYWPKVEAKPGSTVLVPLCGKTLDLLWLSQQGHNVVGVELSKKAVQAFFEEQNLTPQRDQIGPYQRYRSGSITILCGDFFALSLEYTGKLDYLYDRASTVALPETMRQDYAKLLLDLLPAGSRGLSITFDYNQSEMPGPPFSISPDALSELFAQRVSLELLETQDLLPSMPPELSERGLSSFPEHAMLLNFD